MNEREESAGRDDSGEIGVWDAEGSFSVSAAAFSRPVRPVFVTSDVSIKTRATTRNHPLPTTRLPPRPPCSAGICATFHPRPCPRLLLSFSPSPTPEGRIVCRGHTPNIRVEKKKSSGAARCRTWILDYRLIHEGFWSWFCFDVSDYKLLGPSFLFDSFFIV